MIIREGLVTEVRERVDDTSSMVLIFGMSICPLPNYKVPEALFKVQGTTCCPETLFVTLANGFDSFCSL